MLLASRTRELLDAVVAGVGDEDVPAAIHGDASGFVELPFSAAPAARLGEEGSGVRQRLEADVDVESVPLGDEDVPAPVRGKASGRQELPVPGARAAPLGEEGAGIRELPDLVNEAV